MMMLLDKELENWIYTFIKDRLRFTPDYDPHSYFLPFAIKHPFDVYDISQMTDDQIDLVYELVPQIFLHILKPGYHMYAVDWFHNFVLYDPRDINKAYCSNPTYPSYTKAGIPYFFGLLPDGDYYFFLDKYGYWGYLTHPWRQEIWIYGADLVKEFDQTHKQFGWIKKASLS